MPDNENFTLGIGLITKGVKEAVKELEKLKETLAEIQDNSDIKINASASGGNASKTQSKTAKATEKAAKAEEKAAKEQQQTAKSQKKAAAEQIKTAKAERNGTTSEARQTSPTMRTLANVIAAIAVAQRIISKTASEYKQVAVRGVQYNNARLITGVNTREAQAIGQMIANAGGDINSGAALARSMKQRLLDWYFAWEQVPEKIAAFGADQFYNEAGVRITDPIEMIRSINKTAMGMKDEDQRQLYLDAWGLPEQLAAIIMSGKFEDKYKAAYNSPILDDKKAEEQADNYAKLEQVSRGIENFLNDSVAPFLNMFKDDEFLKKFGYGVGIFNKLVEIAAAIVGLKVLSSLLSSAGAAAGAGAAGVGGAAAAAGAAGAAGGAAAAGGASILTILGWIAAGLAVAASGFGIGWLIDKYIVQPLEPEPQYNMPTGQPPDGKSNFHLPMPGEFIDISNPWSNATNTPLNFWHPDAGIEKFSASNFGGSGNSTITIGDIIVNSNASNPVEVAQAVSSELRRAMVEYGSTIKA